MLAADFRGDDCGDDCGDAIVAALNNSETPSAAHASRARGSHGHVTPACSTRSRCAGEFGRQHTEGVDAGRQNVEPCP
jgi:hypothetical protein